MMLPKSFIFLAVFFLFALPAQSAESICFGRPGHGALQNGAQLPKSGANFSVYSHLAAALGRTYVHSDVKTILLAAYTALEKTAPEKVFVYGETGFKKGGRLRPHRTHQNGLSVDFMVPVMDPHKKSVPLPCSPLNRFGYDIEFDKNGKYKDLSIDFEAMAEHLYQLFLQTEKQGKKIALVIFDPVLLPFVFSTERGAFLEKKLPFMKGKAWVRHDEHYHVDFDIPCNPAASGDFAAPSPEACDQFRKWLVKEGVSVRQRDEKGGGIMAAWGQLGGTSAGKCSDDDRPQ